MQHCQRRLIDVLLPNFFLDRQQSSDAAQSTSHLEAAANSQQRLGLLSEVFLGSFPIQGEHAICLDNA